MFFNTIKASRWRRCVLVVCMYIPYLCCLLFLNGYSKWYWPLLGTVASLGVLLEDRTSNFDDYSTVHDTYATKGTPTHKDTCLGFGTCVSGAFSGHDGRELLQRDAEPGRKHITRVHPCMTCTPLPNLNVSSHHYYMRPRFDFAE